APIGLLAGPLLLGVAGIALGAMPSLLGHDVVEPAASAILGHAEESHLSVAINFTSVLLWLSVLTWALGFFVFRQADNIRTVLQRIHNGLGWTADTVFDIVMFSLIRFAGAVTRALHHGRLELYLVAVFIALGLAIFGPLM